MSENLKLGELISTEQARDAVHIAVAPVVAGERLTPGQRIGLANGKAVASAPYIGVVDPFLAETEVAPGERFWMFLVPGSITSLRHEWTHPSFDGNDEVRAARATIERMADNMDLTYSALMGYADDHLAYQPHSDWDSHYVTQQDSELWRDVFDASTFWPAYAVVTGRRVPEDKADAFFSCSC